MVSIGCVSGGGLRRVLTVGLWVLQCPLVSVFAGVGVFVRGFGDSVVSVILEKSLSASLAASVVCCISDDVFRMVWAIALGQWVARVVVCSMFALRGVVVICIVGVVWKSSSAALALGMGSGGGLLRVPVWALNLLCLFSVVVIEKSSSSSIVAIVARKSSSAASAPSVVVCGGCWGLRGVGAFPVRRAGSLGILLSVVLVFSGVFVDCIVVVGCVVVIGVVVSIVRKFVVSRIKPARMLAFSASKSMRCGGGVGR